MSVGVNVGDSVTVGAKLTEGERVGRLVLDAKALNIRLVGFRVFSAFGLRNVGRAVGFSPFGAEVGSEVGFALNRTGVGLYVRREEGVGFGVCGGTVGLVTG